MKNEFSMVPDSLKGEYDTMYSWMELLTGFATPVFVVSGWKPNGKENACLSTGVSFFTDGDGFFCTLSGVGKWGHMYKSLKETGCCVLNFPSRGIYELCYTTVDNNEDETDEITASGLTAEKAVCVNAPRIAECFLNVECEYLWEHQLSENSDTCVIALKVVHIGMDSDRYDQSKIGRYGKDGFVYYVNQLCNPDTGKITSDMYVGIELFNHIEGCTA